MYVDLLATSEGECSYPMRVRPATFGTRHVDLHLCLRGSKIYRYCSKNSPCNASKFIPWENSIDKRE